MELNFKNFLTFEKYKEIADIEMAEKSKEKPDYDKIFESHKLYENAMLNYLKARAENGLLKMPDNSGTHYSNFLSMFKRLVENKLTNNDTDKVNYLFAKVISNNMMKLVYAKEPITVEQNYEELIDKVNKGNFERFDLECDSECFGCGQRIKLVAKDWSFRLATLKLNEDNKYEFKLLPECIEEKIYEVKVEFKTGELLMADWFRIPEFTKQVEYDPEYKKVSINADLGQIKSTEHAASLGFVTVHVGNSSPTIYQQGDNFIFGHEKEESKGTDYQDKGYVCTDLWNVTVIDKSKLIEIVANKLGEEKAIETVEKYLKENQGNINFINVQPGEYVVGFYPRQYINNLDKELPSDIEATFTMKKVLPQKKLKM